MRKSVLHIMICAWAIMMAACSSDSNESDALLITDPAAVAFSTDMNVQTSRTTTGTINTLDDLKTADEGFGVFAYLTDVSNYATKFPDASAFTSFSDFYMYNQQVKWAVQYVDNSSVSHYDWVYTPLKYWPNSSGNATSRYISFFAYAPYIDVAGADWGVVDFTREADRTPHVIYKLGDAANQVDLLYAKFVDATRNGQGLISQSTVDDVTTLTYQKVPLEFHHTLAAIDFYVQRVYDEPAYTGKKPASEQNTKLFVSKLELKSTGDDVNANDLQLTGKLNLYDGTWSDPGSSYAWLNSDVTITYPEAQIADAIRGTDSDNELVIMDTELDKWGTETNGVNEGETYLIKENKTQMLLPRKVTLIPTMTYSMVTRDDDLQVNYMTDSEGHRYSRIVHEVTGNSMTLDLVAGKRYTVLLRISAENISFELLSVIDWDFPMRYNPQVVADFGDEVIGHKMNEE